MASITVEEDEDARADERGNCPGCGLLGPRGRAWWVVHGELDGFYGCEFHCSLECAQARAASVAIVGWVADG